MAETGKEKHKHEFPSVHTHAQRDIYYYCYYRFEEIKESGEGEYKKHKLTMFHRQMKYSISCPPPSHT